MLLEHGADVDALDELNITPLHDSVCRYPQNQEIIALLLDNGADTNIATSYLPLGVEWKFFGGLGPRVVARRPCGDSFDSPRDPLFQDFDTGLTPRGHASAALAAARQSLVHEHRNLETSQGLRREIRILEQIIAMLVEVERVWCIRPEEPVPQYVGTFKGA